MQLLGQAAHLCMSSGHRTRPCLALGCLHSALAGLPPTNPPVPVQIARAAALLAALGSALFLAKMPLAALARHLACTITAAFQELARAATMAFHDTNKMFRQLHEQLASWKPVTTPEGHLPASTVYTSPAHAYGLPRRFAPKVRRPCVGAAAGVPCRALASWDAPQASRTGRCSAAVAGGVTESR